MRKQVLLGIVGGVFWAQSLPSRSWEALQTAVKENPDTLYILNFWATWCRPCVAELPYLQASAQELQGSLPVRIWLISLEFPPEDGRSQPPSCAAKG